MKSVLKYQAGYLPMYTQNGWQNLRLRLHSNPAGLKETLTMQLSQIQKCCWAIPHMKELSKIMPSKSKFLTHENLNTEIDSIFIFHKETLHM